MKGACQSPFEKSLLLNQAVCFHPSLHYQLNCWHQVFKEFQREAQYFLVTVIDLTEH